MEENLIKQCNIECKVSLVVPRISRNILEFSDFFRGQFFGPKKFCCFSRLAFFADVRVISTLLFFG